MTMYHLCHQPMPCHSMLYVRNLLHIQLPIQNLPTRYQRNQLSQSIPSVGLHHHLFQQVNDESETLYTTQSTTPSVPTPTLRLQRQHAREDVESKTNLHTNQQHLLPLHHHEQPILSGYPVDFLQITTCFLQMERC
jgi:hypothetical protein